jgi:myo-inositol-1(or 4)-monophosphatase
MEGNAAAPEELRELALEAALAGAGAIDAVVRGGALEVAGKTSPDDLVTSADTASERAVVESLLRRRPGDAVLAEESGERAGDSGVRWVVDPLDGTMNFVHGRRDWAVAVAAEVGGTLAAGAVCRPAHGDWFAAAGDQARGSAGPLRLEHGRPLAEAIVAVAMPVWQPRRERALRLLAGLLPHVRDFRRTGCAAVELTDIAAGALDGFVTFTPLPWDLLPGQAIATAAGARSARVATTAGELVVVAAPSLAADLVSLVTDLSAGADR